MQIKDGSPVIRPQAQAIGNLLNLARVIGVTRDIRSVVNYDRADTLTEEQPYGSLPLFPRLRRVELLG